MFLCTGAETANGLLLDLTDTLAGKTELDANLLKGHLGLVDAIEGLYDTTLPVVEYLEGIVDL